MINMVNKITEILYKNLISIKYMRILSWHWKEKPFETSILKKFRWTFRRLPKELYTKMATAFYKEFFIFYIFFAIQQKSNYWSRGLTNMYN